MKFSPAVQEVLLKSEGLTDEELLPYLKTVSEEILCQAATVSEGLARRVHLVAREARLVEMTGWAMSLSCLSCRRPF